MNPLTHCMVCHDATHFNTTKHMVENIVYHMKTKLNHIDFNINSLPREYMELKRSLSYDRKHPHFMCGSCFKVNTSELTRLEEELDNCLIYFAYQFKEKDLFYYDTLNLLRGHYPKKYMDLEKFCSKKLKDS